MLFAGRLGHCGEDADGGQQSYVETGDARESEPPAAGIGAGSLGIISDDGAARRGPQRNAEVQRQGELPQSPTSYKLRAFMCAGGRRSQPSVFQFPPNRHREAVYPTFFCRVRDSVRERV